MSAAPEERIRLFVALELPEPIVATLIRWRDEVIGAEAGLRAVAAASLHVTLCFLGWRRAAEIEPIATACAAALDGGAAPELELAEPVWLPPRRPRVLAVALDGEQSTIAVVQSRLSDALEAGGWYTPEARPFLAHVTVARALKDARVRPRELPTVPASRFAADGVTLYRSRLGRGGAQYEPLASFTLTGSRRKG